MTKTVISPEKLEVKELEQKIAPLFYSSVLLDSLWSNVDSYTIGDNSWHWGDTYNRMDSYLGYNYDPMSVIYGNSGGYVDQWSATQSYTDYTLGWMGMSQSWSSTASSVDNYLNSWLYW